MTKNEREQREYISLFTDERYAKKAWKNIIGSSLESDGKSLPTMYDKNGEIAQVSVIDEVAYQNVKNRLEKEGKVREPSQAELIVESNILRARFNDTTFNTILDRTAGKVKEEINVTGNQFEELTDDELNLLLEYRNKQKKVTADDNSSEATE